VTYKGFTRLETRTFLVIAYHLNYSVSDFLKRLLLHKKALTRGRTDELTTFLADREFSTGSFTVSKFQSPFQPRVPYVVSQLNCHFSINLLYK